MNAKALASSNPAESYLAEAIAPLTVSLISRGTHAKAVRNCLRLSIGQATLDHNDLPHGAVLELAFAGPHAALRSIAEQHPLWIRR